MFTNSASSWCTLAFLVPLSFNSVAVLCPWERAAVSIQTGRRRHIGPGKLRIILKIIWRNPCWQFFKVEKRPRFGNLENGQNCFQNWHRKLSTDFGESMFLCKKSLCFVHCTLYIVHCTGVFFSLPPLSVPKRKPASSQ